MALGCCAEKETIPVFTTLHDEAAVGLAGNREPPFSFHP
jgi:hypothetical protein